MVTAAPACGDSSCTGFLVCQNTEGTGYDNSETWTESVASGATIDEDYGTSIRGSQSLRIIGSDADWSQTKKTFTAAGEVYGFVRFRPVDLPAASTIFLGLQNSTTDQFWIKVNGSGYLVAYHGSDSAVASTTQMSVGNTYYIWYYYSKATGGGGNGVWWVKISSTTTMPPGTNYEISGTAGSSTADVDGVYLGHLGTSNEFVADQILLKTTAIGDVCS